MPYLGQEQHSLEAWAVVPSFSTLFAGLVALLFSLFASNTIYNLYFHPLRKYPGPLLARASKFWFIYHWFNGTYSIVALDAHQKYGEIVRLSPSDLSYVHPQAWKDIYGHRNGVAENIKDPRHMVTEDRSHDHIIVADRTKHSQLRRLLSNAFSDKTLRDQEPVIMHYVNLLVSRVADNCAAGTKNIDMLAWYNFATFDIISHLAFDEPLSCLDSSDYHPWVLFIFSMIKSSVKLAAINRVTAIAPLNRLFKILSISPKLLAQRRTNNELVREKLLRRKERSPDYTDFMTHLIAAEEKGSLELGDLQANAVVLMIAGSETTATLLTGATYFLVTNPRVRDKLKAEIRAAFASTDEINFMRVNELPYLLAVLDETLRLYPPAATTLLRVTPPEGANICGDWVPGGTTVGVNMYAAARVEENWEEPLSFVPERFLASEKDGKNRWKRDRKDSSQPFSLGPRNCIGRNLAYMEMRLILVKILWTFDIEMGDGLTDPTKERVYGVWDKKPLPIRLTPVKR